MIRLGLDVGERIIGCAVCDPEGRIAVPCGALKRTHLRRDMAALRDLAREKNVREIVVGMPLMPDGSRGRRAEETEQFVRILRGFIRIPVRYQDERYSTQEAEERLREAGCSMEERRQRVDEMAAAIILQDFLNCQPIL